MTSSDPSRGDSYSPDRRTALVLTGTGADGAYHAGVLRALHEAGIKLDLVCGRGIGVVGALLTAVEGGARLWDAKGLWRADAVARLYRWRWPIGLPLIAGALLAMALVAEGFWPDALPRWFPRFIASVVIGAVLGLVVSAVLVWRAATARRRSRGPLVWTLIGSPLDGHRAMSHFTSALWDLLKGGTTLKAPPPADVSRRFSELLAENLGQPGFRELLLAVHDLDSRRDLIFGLVREPFRRALFPPPTGAAVRRAEAFDLAGLARDHVVDVLRAALGVPGVTEPALLSFAPDSYWRGEAHRLVDRPASLGRLLEEAAAAGAEQVIVVSASPELPGPHELRMPRVDPLGRISDQIAAAETAALRDAERQLHHRFRAVYLIRPQHNPVGAFDLAGAYDEKSDRSHPLHELMQRGYEDAYREFIEPIVAASGEELSRGSHSHGGSTT